MYSCITEPRGRSVIWCIAENAELRKEGRVLVVRLAQINDLADRRDGVRPLRIVGRGIGHLRGNTRNVAIHGDIEIVTRRCRVKEGVEV